MQLIKPTTSQLIDKRRLREHTTHYDITKSKRDSLKGSWTFAKAINLPFNTLISFEFEGTNQHSDILVVRDVCHRCRVFLRQTGVSSAMLWSRFKRPGTNIEEVRILLHIGNVADYVRFVKNVERWQPGADVQAVGYEANVPFKDQGSFTVFDIMFRMLCTESRDKEPSLLYEASSAVVGWMVFESKKLDLSHRIRHREHGKQSSTPDSNQVI